LTAKTGTPVAAMAAAAWSWVEKMLHDAQRTCAPSAVSVSISTAVWIVMCSEPVMRAPLSGCDGPNSARSAIRPGISSRDLDLLAAETGEIEVAHDIVIELGSGLGRHGELLHLVQKCDGDRRVLSRTRRHMQI
jgi:hypothetical protein